MELNTLRHLLTADAQGIKKYDIEQLRLILGVCRYFVRTVEREINRRETCLPDQNPQFL